MNSAVHPTASEQARVCCIHNRISVLLSYGTLHKPNDGGTNFKHLHDEPPSFENRQD